jgi:hypothetical protein
VPERGILQEPANVDLTPLDYLPGCNSPWGNTTTKPPCVSHLLHLPAALFGTDGAYVADPADQKNFVLPTSPGWHEILCVREIATITGGAYYIDDGMTQNRCQDSCFNSGFNYAATGRIGDDWNCVCGTGLDMGGRLYPLMCTAPCPGNSSQPCGGDQYIFNVYYAPPGTPARMPAPVDGAVLLGCYDSPGLTSGLLGSFNYSFTSNAMTTEVCIAACEGVNTTWALTYSGRLCGCGDDWNVLPGILTPSDLCTEACTGNSSETCGDFYKASVYNISMASVVIPVGPTIKGYLGCYQDNGNYMALTNNTFTSSSMTQEQCVNGCSELSYTYAGVKSGNTCYCGNSYSGGQVLPSTQCNTPCLGDSTENCGGSKGVDIYSTAYANVTSASIAATQPRGYLGCFVDKANALAFTTSTYSYYSTSMTVELCKEACTQFNYTYAGVQDARQCLCGNNIPATQQLVSGLNCNNACGGNSSEFCGGPLALDAFAVAGTNPMAITDPSYVGCFDNNNHALSNSQYSGYINTMDICRATCGSKGFYLAGSQGNNCYCGNSTSPASSRFPDSSCSTGCPGNETQACGGASQISVWKSAPDSTAPITHSAGWVSCWAVYTSAPALSGYVAISPSTSAEQCRLTCYNQGNSLAGTSMGDYCYCGNALTSGNAVATQWLRPAVRRSRQRDMRRTSRFHRPVQHLGNHPQQWATRLPGVFQRLWHPGWVHIHQRLHVCDSVRAAVFRSQLCVRRG